MVVAGVYTSNTCDQTLMDSSRTRVEIFDFCRLEFQLREFQLESDSVNSSTRPTLDASCLQVNKQVWTEGSTILYEQTTFAFTQVPQCI
jgi:hypothetical protein